MAPIVGDCAAVAAAAKAVKFVTAGHGALRHRGSVLLGTVNLPAFIYNLAEVNAGDVVSVRLTMSKATCGTWSFDLCMGTFGCPTAPSAEARASCPFVTSLAAG